MENDVSLQSIVESMPGYAYLKNLNFEYILCNRNLASVAGFKEASEIVGKTDKDLIWGSDMADTFQEDDKYVITTGKNKVTEHIIAVDIDDNMKKIYVRTEKIPLRNTKGKVIGILAVALDISDIKKAQDSKSIFISQISHEIKNPLSNLVNLLVDIDSAFKTPNDSRKFQKGIEALSDMHSELGRALGSLNHLIRLHELQLTGVKVNYQLTKIRDMFQEITSEFVRREEKGTEFKINVDKTIPDACMIDYNNVRESLAYIISNAYKYSLKDERIDISVSESSLNGNKGLLIEIKDRGVGMKEGVLQSVNESLSNYIDHDGKSVAGFYRNKYAKPAIKLALAKYLIQASKGSLDLSSAYKLGTLVKVHLPYIESNNLINTVKSKKSNIPKVLIVDDDLKSLNYLRSQIMSYGFECDVASYIEDAVELVRENNFDIIILDITLSDGNGVDLMHRLRQINQHTIYYIAVTSHSSLDSIEHLTEQGFVKVFPKPTPAYLLECCLAEIINTLNENSDPSS